MALGIWLKTKHSDCERGFFYMHHPTDRIAYTTVFVKPVVKHWLEREIAQWDHHERKLLPRSYVSLPDNDGAKQITL